MRPERLAGMTQTVQTPVVVMRGSGCGLSLCRRVGRVHPRKVQSRCTVIAQATHVRSSSARSDDLARHPEPETCSFDTAGRPRERTGEISPERTCTRAFPRKYYWHGNEPDLNAAYLFLQLGRPELTYEWARWIVDTMYSDQPDGVAGNDDGGTLGAWYVLSALGLYPVAGSDRWLVAAPLFPMAQVTVGGHELVIDTEGRGRYVDHVELDGVRLDVLELTHAQLAGASSLRFFLRSK